MSNTTIATIRDAISTINASTDTGRKARVYAAVFMTMCSSDYLIQR
jgi:hypothetical protein